MYNAAGANGLDPKNTPASRRTGNWTKLTCDFPLEDNRFYFTGSDRWQGLDADSAWRDIVRIWQEKDSKDQHITLTFIELVESTTGIGTGANCSTIADGENCDTLLFECLRAADKDYSGPAAELIWNSLVKVHAMYHGYFRALSGLTGDSVLRIDDRA